MANLEMKHVFFYKCIQRILYTWVHASWIEFNNCPTRHNLFSLLHFCRQLYMFRRDPLSIIRSISLYTQQWYMSYRFADSLRAGSGRNWFCSQAVWDIPLLCVQWKTPDDGQRNSPNHVEFYSKYKFEKLVHLVCFIRRIYHDARSPERHIRFILYNFNYRLHDDDPIGIETCRSF